MYASGRTILYNSEIVLATASSHIWRACSAAIFATGLHGVCCLSFKFKPTVLFNENNFDTEGFIPQYNPCKGVHYFFINSKIARYIHGGSLSGFTGLPSPFLSPLGWPLPLGAASGMLMLMLLTWDVNSRDVLPGPPRPKAISTLS